MDDTLDMQVEGSAIIDCGAASTETKGFPFVFIFEFGSPPFDRNYF